MFIGENGEVEDQCRSATLRLEEVGLRSEGVRISVMRRIRNLSKSRAPGEDMDESRASGSSSAVSQDRPGMLHDEDLGGGERRSSLLREEGSETGLGYTGEKPVILCFALAFTTGDGWFSPVPRINVGGLGHESGLYVVSEINLEVRVEVEPEGVGDGEGCIDLKRCGENTGKR